jgi:Family of unknown function (DUF6496)
MSSGKKLRAVALRQMRTRQEIARQKAKVSAFQCKPPPTPLPRMKAPQLRTGSAVWGALLRKVKSRKQAIAVGLSKARKKGKKVPRRKTA